MSYMWLVSRGVYDIKRGGVGATILRSSGKREISSVQPPRVQYSLGLYSHIDKEVHDTRVNNMMIVI